MYEIDIHGMNFKDACEYIKKTINECYKNRVLTIKVIHGYNNGDRIKTWVRNSKELGSSVMKVEPDFFNSGATIINLKLKNY